MNKREIIERFIAFAESKEIELGGHAIHGFAMEYITFVPLHKGDYVKLISDFLASELLQENHQ